MAKFGTVEVYEEMAKALDNDPEWAETGKGITYKMTFTYKEPINKVFFVNFDEGKITEVREAGPDDRSVDFDLAAAPDTWRSLLEGKTNPMMAITRGKLKVDGNLAALMKHMKAFTKVLDAMSGVELV
jgi:putative sterol carrier protein